MLLEAAELEQWGPQQRSQDGAWEGPSMEAELIASLKDERDEALRLWRQAQDSESAGIVTRSALQRERDDTLQLVRRLQEDALRVNELVEGMKEAHDATLATMEGLRKELTQVKEDLVVAHRERQVATVTHPAALPQPSLALETTSSAALVNELVRRGSNPSEPHLTHGELLRLFTSRPDTKLFYTKGRKHTADTEREACRVTIEALKAQNTQLKNKIAAVGQARDLGVGAQHPLPSGSSSGGGDMASPTASPSVHTAPVSTTASKHRRTVSGPPLKEATHPLSNDPRPLGRDGIGRKL
jgi:hypothetical protein